MTKMNRWAVWIVAGAGTISIAALIWKDLVEEKKWERFVQENNCRIVERLVGSTDLGITAAAKARTDTVVLNTPSTIAYLCEDGITYWR